jgi:hypothetical protein
VAAHAIAELFAMRPRRSPIDRFPFHSTGDFFNTKAIEEIRCICTSAAHLVVTSERQISRRFRNRGPNQKLWVGMASNLRNHHCRSLSSRPRFRFRPDPFSPGDIYQLFHRDSGPDPIRISNVKRMNSSLSFRSSEDQDIQGELRFLSLMVGLADCTV